MGDANTKPKAQTGMVVAYYENDYQKYAVEQLMKRQQIQEWYCLWSLWTAESHWRNKAHNKSSGAYGIAQLLPQTWNNIKFKRTSNGYRQIDAGLKYIDRHWGGSPCRAYASELARGWY
jgi:membrane-bound lytic murein transglycosylase MltF